MKEHALQFDTFMLVATLLLLLVVYYMGNAADLFGSVGWHEIASVGWVTAPL